VYCVADFAFKCRLFCIIYIGLLLLLAVVTVGLRD